MVYRHLEDGIVLPKTLGVNKVLCHLYIRCAYVGFVNEKNYIVCYVCRA